MYVILLKFGENRSSAGQFMDGHNQWLRAGFDKGMFLLAGSLQPGLGGGILAQSEDLKEVQDYVNQDPFVRESVVEPEIHQISPAKADDRLEFLLSA